MNIQSNAPLLSRWRGLWGIGAGLFCIFCAAKNYDFFMNDGRAWLFVKLLGRTGARAFYILLGIWLVSTGVLLLAHNE